MSMKNEWIRAGAICKIKSEGDLKYRIMYINTPIVMLVHNDEHGLCDSIRYEHIKNLKRHCRQDKV